LSTTEVVTSSRSFPRLTGAWSSGSARLPVSLERKGSRVGRRWVKLLGLRSVLVMLAAACTGSGDGEQAEGEDAPLPETTAPAAGGGGETEAAGGGGGAAGGSTLQAVQDRGRLICGVNDAVPGFGVTDEEG